jgi:polysaccharide deacetylase family protein (PEP-CTERM system associated)
VAGIHNAFTVDLEEWFHICAGGEALSSRNWDRLPSRLELTTKILLELLDAASVQATFFVVGWVAERHPDLVDTVRRAGHDLGSHGYIHQKAYDLGRDGFRADVRDSVRVLSAIGGGRIEMFRAAEWSINERSPWALEVLVEEGFKLDASMAPVKVVGSVSYPRYPHIRNTPAGPITEVPSLVSDRFGQVMPMGWGWGLRMSSPRRVLKTIDGANRAGQPAVLMVHPWELDPAPPRVRLPARLHFAHYFRLGGFRHRLREVLNGTTFGRLKDLRTFPISP